MPFAEGLCVFLCIFLSVIGDAEGVITSPPLNAVAEVDGEAVFNCSASTAPYAWTLTRDGMATIDEIAITSGCIVTTGLGNHYRTEQPGGPTTCSLIVFDVTMEQAGVYHCVHSDTFRALLTVIDSSSTLTSNNTPDVIETETVVLTCSVNYNGSVSPASTLRPHYYWTDVNGQNVSGFVDKSTENKAVSELSVKAGREDITPFTCHAYLKLDPPFNETGSYAKNTPSVNNNASSTPIVVLYPPIISNISSERRNATSVSCEFNTFSCDATANPVANFTWIDVEEPDRVTYGQSLGYAEFGRNYSCRATNIIRGKHNTDEETHKRNDYDSAIPSCKGCRNSAMNITGPTCTGTTCSCMLNCDMTVICTSDAFPEPMYQWMGNGEITASNNNTLDAVADGTYTCVAKNVIDGHEFEGRIEIKVENCYASTITLIVLMSWLGVCTVVVCVTTIFYRGFKHIMDCCFPFLCTKLESSKCVNVVWIILFLLTSCFASGVVVALTACLCFKDGDAIKADQGSIGSKSSNKHSRKPLVILTISSILFVIDISLWIVAGVGMSSCM